MKCMEVKKPVTLDDLQKNNLLWLLKQNIYFHPTVVEKDENVIINITFVYGRNANFKGSKSLGDV